MTNADIREFKQFVKEVLVKKYGFTEIEAHQAVKNSYLTIALKKDNNYVEHDTVDEWADFIYDEWSGNQLLMM